MARRRAQNQSIAQPPNHDFSTGTTDIHFDRSLFSRDHGMDAWAVRKVPVSPASAASSMSSNGLMYLPKTEWSPRFDSTFFTVTFESKRVVHDATVISVPETMQGRNHYPAYYYEIVIHRGRERSSVWRRFSHFKWLNLQLKASPPAQSQPSDAHAPAISFPSGTCFFQKQDDHFAQDRLLMLQDWLNDVLTRPGYASHPAVVEFLELR